MRAPMVDTMWKWVVMTVMLVVIALIYGWA